MDHKLFIESSTDQKCELLKGELEKVNNRLDNLKGNEADKGVAFVLFPFILMVGYNILSEVFDLFGVIKGVKLAIFAIILLYLIITFLTFYKRIK